MKRQPIGSLSPIFALILFGFATVGAQQFHVIPAGGANLDPCKYFENVTGRCLKGGLKFSKVVLMAFKILGTISLFFYISSFNNLRIFQIFNPWTITSLLPLNSVFTVSFKNFNYLHVLKLLDFLANKAQQSSSKFGSVHPIATLPPVYGSQSDQKTVKVRVGQITLQHFQLVS